MKFWKSSLLAQLVSCFSLLSVVTVSIVAVAAYHRAKDSLQQSVLDRLTVAASLKEYQLNEWVDTQRRDVLLLSQMPQIQEQIAVLLTTDKSSESYQRAYKELTNHFSAIVAVKPHLQSILVTTNGGYVIFSSSDKTLEGKYRPLADPTTYFTREGADTVVPNFYTSPQTGKAAITFATPVLDQKNVRMGAIAINLDLKGVDDLIRERTGLGKSGATYLVGQSASKTVFISGEGAKAEEFANGVNSPGIDAAIAKNDGAGLYSNYKGVPVIGNYRWLTNQNLALIAEMSQQEAFAPAHQLAKDILLIGLSSAALLLVAVYLLSRRMTQPILAIADTAIQVAKGDLTTRAPVLTEDEIGLLARAFNQMITQLKQSNYTLEQQIKSATAVQNTSANLASIIDNIADGLLVTDASGRITRFNPALSELFSLGDVALTNQACYEVLSRELADLVTQTKDSPKEVLTTEVMLSEGRVGKAVATAIFKDSTSNGSEKTYIGSVILLRDMTTEKKWVA